MGHIAVEVRLEEQENAVSGISHSKNHPHVCEM
jgi:hypothetical protein